MGDYLKETQEKCNKNSFFYFEQGQIDLVFPTIYGIALKGMGDDAKFGAAGLIMAILGGSVLPPLQASIIDLEQIAWLPAVNVSFILPFICFLVIIGYGYRTVKRNW